ncbi:hypothetical protein SALBM217S_03593 [Streptomyces griseoloalbus]
MFARCPGLFIQPRTTSAADRCPHAMFSPTVRHREPAAAARSQGLLPSGAVCA